MQDHSWTTISGHHRVQLPPTTTPVMVSDSFSALLQAEIESDEPCVATSTPSWAQNPGERRKVWRVWVELRDWKAHIQQEHRVPPGPMELANNADDFKDHVLCVLPTNFSQFEAVISTSPAFWNRIALNRLRSQSAGSSKAARREYVVVRTLDDIHRLLVLHVPPPVFTSVSK